MRRDPRVTGKYCVNFIDLIFTHIIILWSTQHSFKIMLNISWLILLWEIQSGFEDTTQ